MKSRTESHIPTKSWGDENAWNHETRETIGNALIVAQNALGVAWNLSNSPATEEEHACITHAQKAVSEAIRKGRVLEQQGIVEERGR